MSDKLTHDIAVMVRLIKDESDRVRDERDQLKAENDKLREQVRWLKNGDILHVLTDLEFEEQQKHEREVQASITALDDENKQLRELCEYLWEFAKLCGAYHPFLRELGIAEVVE